MKARGREVSFAPSELDRFHVGPRACEAVTKLGSSLRDLARSPHSTQRFRAGLSWHAPAGLDFLSFVPLHSLPYDLHAIGCELGRLAWMSFVTDSCARGSILPPLRGFPSAAQAGVRPEPYWHPSTSLKAGLKLGLFRAHSSRSVRCWPDVPPQLMISSNRNRKGRATELLSLGNAS
jgi:hypothetical protein